MKEVSAKKLLKDLGRKCLLKVCQNLVHPKYFPKIYLDIDTFHLQEWYNFLAPGKFLHGRLTTMRDEKIVIIHANNTIPPKKDESPPSGWFRNIAIVFHSGVWCSSCHGIYLLGMPKSICPGCFSVKVGNHPQACLAIASAFKWGDSLLEISDFRGKSKHKRGVITGSCGPIVCRYVGSCAPTSSIRPPQ